MLCGANPLLSLSVFHRTSFTNPSSAQNSGTLFFQSISSADAMADFEPLSFSLGPDFDFYSHPQTIRTTSFRLIEDEDDFEAPTLGRDPQVSEPLRTFKRLRCVIAFDSAPTAQNWEPIVKCSPHLRRIGVEVKF
ncbi:hypothetical protein U1Q18_029551 [Sarracenia purpurea var. burkii]